MTRYFTIIKIIIISCLLTITSCTTTYFVSMQPEISKSMVGMSHQAIVSRMGAPDRQTTDGAGGTILIYEDTSSQSIATAHNVNYYTGTYTPGVRTTSHTDYIHIYINSQGKCYKVKTNLTRLESKPAPGKTVFAILGTIATIFVVAVAVASAS